MRDFPTGILDHIAHRPWPAPDAPWLMTQSWHDLLFAHWPVDADLLRTKVPRGFEVDLFDNLKCPREVMNIEAVRAEPVVNVVEAISLREEVVERSSPGFIGRSDPAEATIELNTMAAAAGIHLPSLAPILHFSKRQDMVAWAPVPIE